MMKLKMYILRYLRQADYKRLLMWPFKMCIVCIVCMLFLLCGILFLTPLGFLVCMFIDWNIELLNRLSILGGSNFPHIAEFLLPEEGALGVVQVICLDSIYIICYLLEGVERPKNRMLFWLKRNIFED